MGVPYDPEVAEFILDQIADGFTLEQIEKIQGMPRRIDFLKWRRNDGTLDEQYRQAVGDRVAFSYDRLFSLVNELTGPDCDAGKAQLARYKLAMDTLCKVINAATGPLALGDMESKADEDAIPHIQISFVKPPVDE